VGEEGDPANQIGAVLAEQGVGGNGRGGGGAGAHSGDVMDQTEKLWRVVSGEFAGHCRCKG